MTRHPVAVLVLLLLLLLCFLVSAVSSIFPTLGRGLANALSGTSYASEDTDLLGVDEDYTALENELAQTVATVSYTHLDVYKRQAGVFSMIRQISETAILPIAGVILTFVTVSYTHLDVYKRQVPTGKGQVSRPWAGAVKATAF